MIVPRDITIVTGAGTALLEFSDRSLFYEYFQISIDRPEAYPWEPFPYQFMQFGRGWMINAFMQLIQNQLSLLRLSVKSTVFQSDHRFHY
jgi:hypothetical protein